MASAKTLRKKTPREKPSDHDGDARSASKLPKESILIRPVEPSDADDLHAINTGRSVMPMTGGLPSVSRAAIAERLATKDDNNHILGAVFDGRVVGMGGLRMFPRLRMRHSGMLFLEVHEKFHGRGVGRALMEAIMDLADRWMGLSRVQLEVSFDNAPAIHLYKEFGFEEEGRLRKNFFRDGEYIDSLVMGRLRFPTSPTMTSVKSGAKAR